MTDGKRENSALTPEEITKLADLKKKSSPESLEFRVHSAADREQIQTLARQVKQAVLEIIQERGWSTESDSGNRNLAFRLSESNLDRIILTGRTSEELDFRSPKCSGLIITLNFDSREVLD